MTEAAFDPARTAAALLGHRRAREVLRALPPGAAPRSLEQGVAAQVALARAVGAVPPAGFKIGATAQGMQQYLGRPRASWRRPGCTATARR